MMPKSNLRQVAQNSGSGIFCALAGGGMSIISLLVGMLQGWWILKAENKQIGSFIANFNQKDLEDL